MTLELLLAMKHFSLFSFSSLLPSFSDSSLRTSFLTFTNMNRNMKQVAAQLKPETKKKNLKARVEIKRLKSKMGTIRGNDECLKDEQRKISSRSGEIERQIDQLKAETEMIVKQTARTQIKVVLMFNILKARESGDCIEAATLTHCLRELVAMERANASSGEHPQ